MNLHLNYSRRLPGPPRFFPTYYESDSDSLPKEGEEYDKSIHRFQDPSIVFEDDGSDRQPASKTKAKTAAGKKKK